MVFIANCPWLSYFASLGVIKHPRLLSVDGQATLYPLYPSHKMLMTRHVAGVEDLGQMISPIEGQIGTSHQWYTQSTVMKH